MKHFNVALLGFGTVGSGVYRILNENGDQIAHREGIALSCGRILVRDFEHEPNLDMAPRELFTTAVDEIISDPSIDIVVECMGGIEPAKTFIIRALEAGKTVVTSNKEVMSKNWPAFEKAAKATGAGLYLEATVGGGIPIIRTILDSMQANNITRVMGIINGTTNYILTQMTENGQSFEDALADAQALGYAEANPTADVEGYDAMYKLSILSSMAFHARVQVEYIYREGIVGITQEDIAYGSELGYTVKLLAIGKKRGKTIEARVHPTMIPKAHPLASVRGAFNAIYLHGNIVDDIMLYGRGAGDMPTASAVVSDIIYAAGRDQHHYTTFYNEDSVSAELSFENNWECEFFIRLVAQDKPGVLAKIASAFGKHGVSIESVRQQGESKDSVPLILITHKAKEISFRRAIEEISEIPEVISIANTIRVEK